MKYIRATHRTDAVYRSGPAAPEAYSEPPIKEARCPECYRMVSLSASTAMILMEHLIPGTVFRCDGSSARVRTVDGVLTVEVVEEEMEEQEGEEEDADAG